MNQVEIKRQRIQLFSGVISMVMLLVLGMITGNNGIAYIAVAAECFLFVTALISSSASDALGKILRGKSARGQYKNVLRLRKNAMLLQCISGGAGAVALAALANPLAVYVFQLPYSVMLILTLAPAVFLRSVSAVLLGYFQGDGFELPTAATAIIRPLFSLGFACLFCNILKGYGTKVSNLLGKAEFTSMYSGIGAVIAVGLTEVLIILFLLLIHRWSKRGTGAKQDEGMKTVESFADMCRLLYTNMGMSLLLRLFLILPLGFGMIFFFKSVTNIDAAAENYGLYFGKYLAFFGLFFFLLCGILLPVCNKTAVCLKKEEHRYAKNSFQKGIYIAWAGALFLAVVSAVMAKQLAAVLYGGVSSLLENMLRFGGLQLIFAVLAFYFGKILLLMGKQYFVLGSLGVLNILFMITAVLFLNAGHAGILSLVYAGVIGTVGFAGALGFLVFRNLRMEMPSIPIIFIPAGAGVVAGLICLLFDRLLTPHLGNIVTLCAGCIVSFLVFWGILLALRNFRP